MESVQMQYSYTGAIKSCYSWLGSQTLAWSNEREEQKEKDITPPFLSKYSRILYCLSLFFIPITSLTSGEKKTCPFILLCKGWCSAKHDSPHYLHANFKGTGWSPSAELWLENQRIESCHAWRLCTNELIKEPLKELICTLKSQMSSEGKTNQPLIPLLMLGIKLSTTKSTSETEG